MKLSALLAEIPHLRRREGVVQITRLLDSVRTLIGDPEIEDITFDSRDARLGTLFVALVGATSDGHRFIEGAIERGAAAVLVNEYFEGEIRGAVALETDDTRARLGEISDVFFDHPSRELEVIGITGTNGKTTITFLLEHVLRAAGRLPGVLGTVNYRWDVLAKHSRERGTHVEPAPNTTPESLIVHRLLRRMRDDGVTTVAMEVSSHGLATHRVEGVMFDVGIFTNLSQDHLDFHESMEDYRDAKASLFTDHLERAANAAKIPVAVLNVDDPEGARLAKLALPAVQTYSAAGAAADWRATTWEQSLAGTRIELETPHGACEMQTRLLGAFNVSNVLATLAACDAVGVPIDVASKALRELRGVPGRLQHLGGGDAPDVFVDYAHTPDALRRALEALRPLAPERLVVIFGCGGDRDRDKRPLMGAAAHEWADFVVLTSDNPRSEDPDAIIDDIVRAMGGDESPLDADAGWTRITDRRDAILEVVKGANPSDVILVAGKGHETYQEVAGQRLPFDDVAVVREALS